MDGSNTLKSSLRRKDVVEVEIANQQSQHGVDQEVLVSAAQTVLQEEGIRRGTVSLAVVDRATIHRLNLQHLKHDYPTDVLSYTFQRDGDSVEGEVVVCADVAAEAANQFGWQTSDELVLYTIHGVLHLVGYDDRTEPARRAMRQRERYYLKQYNLVPQYEDEA